MLDSPTGRHAHVLSESFRSSAMLPVSHTHAGTRFIPARKRLLSADPAPAVVTASNTKVCSAKHGMTETLTLTEPASVLHFVIPCWHARDILQTVCMTRFAAFMQGEAIAVNLREMFGFRVPILSVVIGEGGSGGALAIGCANRNLIMEHSVYYVASPEACAAILWKARDKAATVSHCKGCCWVSVFIEGLSFS